MFNYNALKNSFEIRFELGSIVNIASVHLLDTKL